MAIFTLLIKRFNEGSFPFSVQPQHKERIKSNKIIIKNKNNKKIFRTFKRTLSSYQ